MLYDFCSKFRTLSSSAKFLKSVKILQIYREFKGGNVFETQCSCTLSDVPSSDIIFHDLYHMLVNTNCCDSVNVAGGSVLFCDSDKLLGVTLDSTGWLKIKYPTG